MFRSGVFRASRFLHKRIPFKLADIGEGISEVQIIQWHVKEGSPIKQFEKIAEVQSDKATVEITSRYDGIVKKLHYKANDMAKVGEPLIDIETESTEKETLEETAKEESQPSESVNVNTSTNSSDLQMLPSVRKYVQENQIDLGKLNLSGRITKEAILAALSKTSSASEFKELQMNPVQRAMARAMTESLKIPHFGYNDEFRMDALIKKRQENNEQSPVKLSIMPFIIRAIRIAMKDFPGVNAHYVNDKLMCSSVVNLGIAVDTPQGLVVPVLKNVTESIEEIAANLADLTDRARRNKLIQSDFEGATLTISNIGTIGGTYASPVIVPPQVCIGAIGKIRTVPVYTENGGIEPQKMACFSWSADHRAVDGATMARFSNRIKEIIERGGE